MNFIWLKYLKYLFFSRHRKGHGIHSPFVFGLVSEVFRNKIDPGVVLKIETIRKMNLSGSRVISVTDLGAGSVKMKNSLRKVSDIVKYSSVPLKYGKLLYRIAERFGSPDIIELGTSAGISTMYLASANRGTVVHSIEGCTAAAEIAQENFKMAGISNIDLMTGSFDELLPGLTDGSITPGLVFLDGNHRKEPTIRYFNAIAAISSGSTLVVIDDIHSGDEMEDAWSVIKDHGRVSVSVDIFRMGLVFFREGISRGHYIIRY
ncbi:MAG: class I SAM-dependent methyltransferase [Bacteroidota bacterium]